MPILSFNTRQHPPPARGWEKNKKSLGHSDYKTAFI